MASERLVKIATIGVACVASVSVWFLPACRRLLFPLLHAEKKGNRRRLHAGNLVSERKKTVERYYIFSVLTAREMKREPKNERGGRGRGTNP